MQWQLLMHYICVISVIYQLAPMVAKKMGCNEKPVVIVVSPLVTLMDDQVKESALIILLLLPACIS